MINYHSIKFSVIIPVYNVEQYLRECVHSVLSQTYDNYEIILIDDGSLDNSGKICDELAKNNSHIKVIHQENIGLSGARNSGIVRSTGDYLIFLDSDDFWVNENLLKETNMNLLETNADLLFLPSIKAGVSKELFNGRFNRENLRLKDKDSALNYLFKGTLYKACAWDKIVKSSVVNECGLKFCQNRLCEDQLWCAELLLNSSSYDCIESISHCYRLRENSISTTIDENLLINIMQNLDDVILLANNSKSIKMKTQLFSFLSYEYLVLLSIVNVEMRSKYFGKLIEYRFLLKYGIQNKVRYAYLINVIFGLNLLCSLLTIIKKYR